jgi:TonB family protein
MSRITILAAATCCMMSVGVHATTPPPPVAPLTPSSPWNVDYAENECGLLRTFGTGDDQIILRIARSASEDDFDLVIAGANLPRLPYRITLNVGLEPSELSVESPGYSTDVPGNSMRFLRSLDVGGGIFAGLPSARVIRIAAGRYQARLAVGEMAGALRALDVCRTDLFTEWGVDMALARSLVSAPVEAGDTSSWVTPDDYPPASIRNNETGLVTVVLAISAEGGVTNCRVASSSSFAALDETACRVLSERGRYNPAIGSGGVPVASQMVQRIYWRLPE